MFKHVVTNIFLNKMNNYDVILFKRNNNSILFPQFYNSNQSQGDKLIGLTTGRGVTKEQIESLQ